MRFGKASVQHSNEQNCTSRPPEEKLHSAIIIHRDSNMSIRIDQRSGVIRGCSAATSPAANFPTRRDVPAVSGNHAELRTAPRLVWKPWSMASGSGKETVWWEQITMIRAARGVSGSTCQRARGDWPSSLNVWTDDWEYLMVEGTWLLHQDLAEGKISTTNYTCLGCAYLTAKSSAVKHEFLLQVPMKKRTRRAFSFLIWKCIDYYR